MLMYKLTGWLLAGGLALGAMACGDESESADGSTASVAGAGGGSTASTTTTTAASGGGEGGGATASATGTGGTGGSAEPTVTASVDPATVSAGETVTVTITVENFTLVAPGGANEDGEGHYHIYLDGASGGNYLANGQTPTKVVTIPAATAPGPHTLRISVSSNDHVALSPAVEDILDITVQ
jgi:hypothetical protein